MRNKQKYIKQEKTIKNKIKLWLFISYVNQRCTKYKSVLHNDFY